MDWLGVDDWGLDFKGTAALEWNNPWTGQVEIQVQRVVSRTVLGLRSLLSPMTGNNCPGRSWRFEFGVFLGRSVFGERGEVVVWIDGSVVRIQKQQPRHDKILKEATFVGDRQEPDKARQGKVR